VALRKLKRRVLGVCEELMRGMERMDALLIDREDEVLRSKRKNVVKNTEVRTPTYPCRGPSFSKCECAAGPPRQLCSPRRDNAGSPGTCRRGDGADCQYAGLVAL